LPLRTVSIIYNIPYVTLWRWCRTISRVLANTFEQVLETARIRIVDTTSTRIRTTDPRYYTSYKKQRVVKAQVICDEGGHIHSISNPYAGSVHDKVIWNNEWPSIGQVSLILADKAYVGPTGERSVLFRPIKKNEGQWKRNPVRAKAWNKQLSKRRVKIEHVFAHLKTWRIIHHYFPQSPDTYSTVLKAIAFIYNLKLKGNFETSQQ